MDGSRFDDFTRTLAISRRGALKIMLRGAAVGVAAALTRQVTEVAAVATDEAEKARRNPFYRAGKPCDASHLCGSRAPCQFDVCTPIACRIHGHPYDNVQPNPDNFCQFCAPTLETWTEWGILSDGADCGPNQYCCNGECCGETECCISGACEECGSHCTIEGVVYNHTEVFPPGGCQYCNVLRDPTAWSMSDDGAACGDAMDQVCCFGNCCIQNSCCNEERECATECDICRIEGIPYDNLQVNPANACQICDTSHRATSWWPMPERTPCETPPGGLCCDGVCCNPGECCDAFGACATSGCDQCRIEGIDYDDDVRNPVNDCELCDASRTTIAWTPRPNNLSCTSTPGGFCCNGLCLPIEEFCDGVCLPPGECCTADGNRVDGECAPGCTIDGAQYANGEVNPDNVCQACDEGISTTSWSANGFGHCGPNQDQWCCDGVCCDLGVCCNLGTLVCDPDYCHNCVIGGAVYRHGDRNPANGCEQCNADLNPTSWSFLEPNYYCDLDAQDQVCCNGICCDPGLFCNTDGFFCDDFGS